MTEKRTVLTGVSLVFLCLAGCRQAKPPSSETIRFLDLLGTGNIRSSPFLAGPGRQALPRLAPATAYPIRDLLSGENPIDLKVKLGFRGSMMEVILAPPRSEYAFDVVIPPDGILEFGTGIIRDQNSRKAQALVGKDPQEVRFVVRLETKGGKQTIFQKILPVPPKMEHASLSFTPEKVVLGKPGLPVRLTLLTDGDPGAFSFWYNPVIYRQRAESRGVILISLDALRPDHLGCYGYSRPTSPHIDVLAQDGVLFEQAYATSNWTLPSHISIFSSLCGAAHGVCRHNQRIPSSVVMLAEILRKNGFFCYAVTGSGFVSPFYGFWRGFDIYQGGPGALSKENSAKLVFEAAADWLEDKTDQDFFLFLHTYQVHGPYDPPAPYDEMFVSKNARWSSFGFEADLGGRPATFRPLPESDLQNIVGLYDGDIRYADDALIGPLIGRLKELRLYDRTLIILLSDHGEEFMERGSWQHGQSLYEVALHVPLIIKLPGSRSRGKRVRGLGSLVDIMPTILDELKIKTVPPDLDGKSLSPLIKGKKRDGYAFLADTFYPSLNLNDPEVKPGPQVPDIIAFVDRDYKLILNRELSKEQASGFSPPRPIRPDVELYDRQKDPGEKTNLAAERPDVVRRMLGRIQEIYKRPAKAKASQIKIDGKLEEELRALGYIR